jgi:DNA-binding transcriptional ArsR family regulator
VTPRPDPTPPRPGLERRPAGAFGWLQAELLHERWLAEVGPHAAAVLVLLALAADRHGASFFSRSRMAEALGMTRHEVDLALQRLLDAGLVDLRPWRNGIRDGVWQLVPPPPRRPHPRARQSLSVADVLRNLGFRPA